MAYKHAMKDKTVTRVLWAFRCGRDRNEKVAKDKRTMHEVRDVSIVRSALSVQTALVQQQAAMML